MINDVSQLTIMVWNLLKLTICDPDKNSEQNGANKYLKIAVRQVQFE
ncbi:hypothetical protein BTN49_0679 [Candidatus Enterovibrio escicola]|uniref:Uncharacterized protein n=1 Tax=Candidatus Enterovibrio escicola TaxID=1927127 RepID=A0A2A5T6J7_9GAMM|nr:hypothetical protein BTN49_0679 [Candidatus Enterovibrio escacola]